VSDCLSRCGKTANAIRATARRSQSFFPDNTSISAQKQSLARRLSLERTNTRHLIFTLEVSNDYDSGLTCSGILLGIDQLSPNVFSEINIIIASNEVGVFSLEMNSVMQTNGSSSGLGANMMGREEIRMEDLLQAQWENELNLLLFDGMATFSINMLIHQINKSESSVPDLVAIADHIPTPQSFIRRNDVASNDHRGWLSRGNL
jgi:hypothetical protein